MARRELDFLAWLSTAFVCRYFKGRLVPIVIATCLSFAASSAVTGVDPGGGEGEGSDPPPVKKYWGESAILAFL